MGFMMPMMGLPLIDRGKEGPGDRATKSGVVRDCSRCVSPKSVEGP